MLIIAIFLISFIFYHKQQQNKNALAEARQTTYQLKEMTNKKDNAIHDFIVKEFNVAKKISLLEGYLVGGEKGKDVLKKVNKILYEKDNLDWTVLYQVMNKLYQGYLDKFKTKFPDLSELEYKICCLTKSGFNNTEIAIILKSNTNIIQIRKTTIRQKLNITKHGDITKFIDEIING
jgi:ATP/maltotriose-dependent transcriptional regulator MalT